MKEKDLIIELLQDLLEYAENETRDLSNSNIKQKSLRLYIARIETLIEQLEKENK